MAEKTEQTLLEEIAALKAKFETIKADTEEFIEGAKRLSDKGANEAKDLIESAKKNWQGIMSAFSSTGISSLFGGAAKKTAAPSKGKKAAKKVVKKAAKKTVKAVKRTTK